MLTRSAPSQRGVSLTSCPSARMCSLAACPRCHQPEGVTRLRSGQEVSLAVGARDGTRTSRRFCSAFVFALPVALLCRPSGYADLDAGKPRVPGVRDEVVGVIACREARRRSRGHERFDEARRRGDDRGRRASRPCRTLMRRRSPRGMLDNRRSAGKDEHALPVRRLDRPGPYCVEIIPTADPNGIDGLRS